MEHLILLENKVFHLLLKKVDQDGSMFGEVRMNGERVWGWKILHTGEVRTKSEVLGGM